ncbi:hypothetical protein RDI58_028619 [Solanum bulbocastanum]|uniref:Uncharacterized protein n=1 Tax=Solanum bulbocastanum TaxID=147425 RepID=A0AAN8XZ70_SOLBU
MHSNMSTKHKESLPGHPCSSLPRNRKFHSCYGSNPKDLDRLRCNSGTNDSPTKPKSIIEHHSLEL